MEFIVDDQLSINEQPLMPKIYQILSRIYREFFTVNIRLDNSGVSYQNSA